jgi:hypothetical protein
MDLDRTRVHLAKARRRNPHLAIQPGHTLDESSRVDSLAERSCSLV